MPKNAGVGVGGDWSGHRDNALPVVIKQGASLLLLGRTILDSVVTSWTVKLMCEKNSQTRKKGCRVDKEG